MSGGFHRPRERRVFLFDGLTLDYTDYQIDTIVNRYERGEEPEDIAKDYYRLPEEIFLVLVDQAIKGNITRPFATRPRAHKKAKEPAKPQRDKIILPPPRKPGKRQK